MTAKKKRVSLKALDPVAASDRGYELELRDPFTNEPLGMFITVMGQQSTVFRKYQRAKLNERLDQEGMSQAKSLTVEELEEGAIEACVLCTKGWRDIVWDDAEGELEFTPENARMLYTHEWIRRQVDAAITTLGNFAPAV